MGRILLSAGCYAVEGISFNIYPGFGQDELGILTLPGGNVRVAWFKDPDGNVLSVTNA
jgi:hypothetical protein